MIGKTVKVSDPYLLRFFYPDFQVVTEITYSELDRDVIYAGASRKNLVNFLSKNTRRFINTVGTPDMDFANKEQIAKWVFSKKGKTPTEKQIETIKNQDDDFFMYSLKVFWITGKWVGGSEESDTTMFDLFQASVSSLKDVLKIYFKLVENLPPQVVESSFLTFLSRVHNLDDQSVNPHYLRLLKQALMRWGPKVKPAVYKLALRKDGSPELAFLDLITDLR